MRTAERLYFFFFFLQYIAIHRIIPIDEDRRGKRGWRGEEEVAQREMGERKPTGGNRFLTGVPRTVFPCSRRKERIETGIRESRGARGRK